MEYNNCGECKHMRYSSDKTKYWCLASDNDYDIDFIDFHTNCDDFAQSEESIKMEIFLEENE